ncbi:MAG: hypothetical protein AAB778_01975 [Patescibacteria group bacterium]
MIKIVKYFLLFLSLFIIIVISYLTFESFSVKKGVNYNKFEEVPHISWLNIRSGIFGLAIKTTIDKTLVSYDETKYISVIAPSEDRFEEYSEASLYYLVNGMILSKDTDTKLVKYPAVFRTKFKKTDYLLLLQENIQKDKKTGYILIIYPLNLIQNKTIEQFIDRFKNQSFPAPIFSSLYKFDSVETCNQKFNDKNYCQWLLSKQKAIYKIVKKWGDTGIVPIGMMRYPLIINKNRV